MLRCMVIFSILLMAAVTSQEKSCGNPCEIINGHYQTQGSYLIGATIKAVCNEGYVLRGQRDRTCRDSGWDGSTPICEKKSCGNPGVIVNGHYQTPDGFLFGATITALCNEGYVLRGQRDRRCKDSGWDESAPACEKITCDSPSIPNAVINWNTQSYNYGDSIHITCNVGYRKQQSDKLTCGQNGWKPSVQWCIEITCKSPTIKSAVINPSSSPYKYGISVQILCNEGHKIEGSDNLTCWDNGWNSSLPKCIEITCDSPSIPNGVISESSPRCRYGDSIEIWCNDGYRIDGSNNLTCREHGWSSPLPQCIDRLRVWRPVIIGTVVIKLIILTAVGVALLWWMKNKEREECKAPSNPEDCSLVDLSSSDSIAEET